MEPVRYTNLTKVFKIFNNPNVHRFFKFTHKVTEISLSIAFLITPQAEALLAVTSLFRDDNNFDKIMSSLRQIDDVLNKIQQGMETNARTGRWNHVKSVLSPCIHTLEESIQFYYNASSSENPTKMTNWIDELLLRKVSICSSYEKLLNALVENREFNENIWEPYYEFVRGDRYKVENFSRNMYFLILNGFRVTCLTLTLSKDFEWCEEYVEKLRWKEKIDKAVEAMKSCVQKCMTEYDTNIGKDVSNILRSTKEDLPDHLNQLFNKKFKWLQSFCIIYNCNSSETKYLTSDKHLLFKSRNFDKIDGVAFDGPGDEEDEEEDEEIIEDHDEEMGAIDDENKESSSTSDEINQSNENKSSGNEGDTNVSFDNVDSVLPNSNCVVLCIFVREKPATVPAVVSDENYFKVHDTAEKIIKSSIKKLRSSKKTLAKIKEGLESQGIEYWGLAVLNHWNPLKNIMSKIMHQSSPIDYNHFVHVKHKSHTVYLLLNDSQPRFSTSRAS